MSEITESNTSLVTRLAADATEEEKEQVSAMHDRIARHLGLKHSAFFIPYHGKNAAGDRRSAFVTVVTECE